VRSKNERTAVFVHFYAKDAQCVHFSVLKEMYNAKITARFQPLAPKQFAHKAGKPARAPLSPSGRKRKGSDFVELGLN